MYKAQTVVKDKVIMHLVINTKNNEVQSSWPTLKQAIEVASDLNKGKYHVVYRS